MAGIALSVGGLVIGALFDASVTEFTDAFIGLSGTGNFTGASASVADIVPVIWVLGFLGVFLAVFIGTIKKAQ
jgi:hypothetical protein